MLASQPCPARQRTPELAVGPPLVEPNAVQARLEEALLSQACNQQCVGRLQVSCTLYAAQSSAAQLRLMTMGMCHSLGH